MRKLISVLLLAFALPVAAGPMGSGATGTSPRVTITAASGTPAVTVQPGAKICLNGTACTITVDSVNGLVGATTATTMINPYFVDSVNGLDTNDGRSASTPLQTIAALLAKNPPANSTIYLARGSKWREVLGGLALGVNVIAYGQGPRPVLDASKVAANASFTKTAGYTNIYQIAWTHSMAAADRHRVWENNVRLTRVTTLALCDSTAGSFYAPTVTANGTDTVYVHASDNSAVNTNGKTYELAALSNPIVGAIGGQLIGLHGRRAGGNSGCVLSYYYARDCLAEDGTIHNFWVIGVAEDCIAWKNEDIGIAGGSTLFISYADNGGKGVLYRRCIAIGEGDADTLGYYHHSAGSTFGGPWGTMIYENCTAMNLQTGFGGVSSAKDVFINPTTYRVAFALSFGSSTAPASVVVEGGTLNGWTYLTPIANAAVTYGPTNGSLTMRGVRIVTRQSAPAGHINASGTVDIQRCTIAMVDGTGFPMQAISMGAGTLNLQNNIISGFTRGLNCPAGVTVTSNNNVWFGETEFIWNGTTYSTFAAYKTASAQDAASSTADPGYIGQPRAGNLAISSTSPAWSLMAGADYEALDPVMQGAILTQTMTP